MTPDSDATDRPIAVGQGAMGARLRDVGLVPLLCDLEGHVTGVTPSGVDWLTDLIVHSPTFTGALRRVVARWALEEEPELVEALPGLWLAPTPLTVRRSRSGYAVVVIPTVALIGSPVLTTLCRQAGLDAAAVRRRLGELPPAGEGEVERLACLAQLAHEDESRLVADGHAMESVSQQLAESYEEISLLYSMIQSMTVVQRPARFVTMACQELLGTLPYAWVGAILSGDRARLKKLAGRFICAGDAPVAESKLRSVVGCLLARAEAGLPMVLEPETNPDHAHFRALGRTALVHPISSDGRVLGLLIAGDRRGSDPVVSSVDMKLLAATASNTALFVAHAGLYDDLNAMFLGTLEALTASIDAKDRYTCGHSERVAHLTMQLAEAIGLDETQVARTRIAGLVHDVGKIGVPERVLLKPGRLTADEFDRIREHPEIGHGILKDIPQLGDILPGVLHHHERWDGAGYPTGLSGPGIPLLGRLIALADSFDAMSSNRTYRVGMVREDVLAEIARCAGTQFDPGLVPFFLGLDLSEFDEMLGENSRASAA